jgi:hypothetical protein
MIDFIYKLFEKIKKIDKNNLKSEYFELMKTNSIDILKFLFLKVHNIIFDDNQYYKQIKRIHQSKFKKELIELYGNKCIVSGVTIFQACHIKPFSKCDFVNKYDKYNGILLKADLHELFDDYIFSINPDTFTVEFNNDFFENNQNFKEYGRFNNFKLNLEDNDTLKCNILEHYNTFINKN